MKNKLLTILILMTSMSSFAQNKHELKSIELINLYDSIKFNFVETEDGIKFTRVIEIPNVSKELLYVNALESLAKLYKDSKEVIQSKDKETGAIFGKGLFIDDGPWIYRKCEHSVKVEVKDNRCRIVLSIGNVYMLQKSKWDGHVIYAGDKSIKDYFPLWKDCPLNEREKSMDTFIFCYANSIEALNRFEVDIKNATKSNKEEW